MKRRPGDAPVSLAQLRSEARSAERGRQGADGASLRALVVIVLCCALGLALAFAFLSG